CAPYDFVGWAMDYW
nr:immunoglobulin heavy chain junction region [Mus musculus]MBK4186878.1 immunoglobulin heavy chain junction region [Mus musculus]MBK4186879.1 immunoglobulin heavy chain junction region [Mus musculus]MBK4186880.1 immunoglobulin heavy chain junction region [Mus musculus]